MQDIILIVLVVVAFLFAIRRVFRRGKGDCGCGGGSNCPNCKPKKEKKD